MSRIERPDITVGEITWSYLGSGNYNDAYVASIEGQRKVYKIPKARTSSRGEYSPLEEAMDIPDRAVRLWNEVNPRFPAEKYDNGWIAPFIEGENPSSREVCDAIIDLYQRTGRVLADAMPPGNFKKLSTGEIVCVDIGIALKLEGELEDEKSQASLDFWAELKSNFDKYFHDYRNHAEYGPIGNMTKALLFLQQFRPDVRDVERLKSDPSLVSQLVNAYEKASILSLDIYHTFPINLDYFSKIPSLRVLLSAENIPDEYKRQLCQLYQLKKFRHTWNADALIKLFNLPFVQLSLDQRTTILSAVKNNLGTIITGDQLVALLKLSAEQLSLDQRTMILSAVENILRAMITDAHELIKLFRLPPTQLSQEQREAIWSAVIIDADLAKLSQAQREMISRLLTGITTPPGTQANVSSASAPGFFNKDRSPTSQQQQPQLIGDKRPQENSA